MLVFANAVAFAVAVPDIATTSICCEQYAAGLHEFYYHSEKLPEIRCPYPKTCISLPWLSYVLTRSRLKKCVYNIGNHMCDADKEI